MSNLLKIIHIKRCFLLSNNAEPGPPLGTILGNLGVNTIKFCEEFNKFTSNLSSYFMVKVVIFIYENRSFSFKIKMPSTGFLLNLLKFEKKIRIKFNDRFHEQIVLCIKLDNLIKLALFKFPLLDIKHSIFLIWGAIKSMNIIIIY